MSPADNSSPLLIATINGHFDLAMYLLEHGADPNLASDAGATPLYAALNVQWAPKAFYPQPRAYLQQRTSYLELMKALLDKGADPNARLQAQDLVQLLQLRQPPRRRNRRDAVLARRLCQRHRGDEAAASRAAPIRTCRRRKPAGRTTRGDPGQPQVPIEDKSGKPPVPVGGPGIPPLQAAAGSGYGEGFAGNAHRFAPTGMLAAVKYLVEELQR